MRPITKLRLTAAVMLAAMLGVGCNPLTGAYFMLFGVDDKIPPEFKLAKDDKHTVHVAILTSSIQESRAELLGIERQLGGNIAKALDIECKQNKEKVQVVPVHKIEEFKTNNPGWKTMPQNEIGRKFDADYLVDVEVAALTLYEKDSRKQLFRGRSAITLSVYDVTKPIDEGPAFQKRLSVEYPKAQGPIPVDDETTVEKFRDTFVQRIAQEVAWQLTSHISTAGLMQD